jgi:hypothetical protein
MGSGDAYDVFVSYARSDESDAAELNGWHCQLNGVEVSFRSPLG